ncbi:MAG: hypothetical protein ACXADY_22450 [Candidatus Hodarchaeales archaeon]|jgi:hypothetical protein
MGYLVCPNNDLSLLKTYISRFKEEDRIILHEMGEIVDLYRSTSLNLFKKKNRWQTSLPTNFQRITLPLRRSNPRKTGSSLPEYFLTYTFNKKWNYNQYPDPAQVIVVYCEAVKEFNVQNLLYSSSEFSRTELSLLRYLDSKRISQVNLFFYTLLQLFSPDTYLITLNSSVPLYQLDRLLFWLPFSHVYYTETSTKILTILTPEIVKWLEANFNWDIHQVALARPFHKPHSEWFNPKTLEWKTPSCLDRI